MKRNLIICIVTFALSLCECGMVINAPINHRISNNTVLSITRITASTVNNGTEITTTNNLNNNNKNNVYCYMNNPNPYMYFGTKTAYEVVRGDFVNTNVCPAVQIWIFSRHGTRYFNKFEMSRIRRVVDLHPEIVQNAASGRTSMCPADLEALRRWSWDTSVEEKLGSLNERGWLELYLLAKRLKRIYPELFPEYAPNDYNFRHTVSTRTRDSCYAFADGLFGAGFHGNITTDEPYKTDPVVRSFAVNKAYLQSLKEDVPAYDEFIKSKPYKKFQADLSRRLGMNKKLIDPVDIAAMYDMCAYEKATTSDEKSPWCGVFTADELALLEYDMDLQSFYQFGPGHRFSTKLGCPSLQHLRETFEKTVENEGVASPKTVAMFSHDISLGMAFTAMGYFGDVQHMPSQNYEDQLLDRRFRQSRDCPFSANFVAVLHRCSPTDYKVQLLNNERPMEVKNCPKGLCTWEEFQKLLLFTRECKLDISIDASTAQSADALR